MLVSDKGAAFVVLQTPVITTQHW